MKIPDLPTSPTPDDMDMSTTSRPTPVTSAPTTPIEEDIQSVATLEYERQIESMQRKMSRPIPYEPPEPTPESESESEPEPEPQQKSISEPEPEPEPKPAEPVDDDVKSAVNDSVFASSTSHYSLPTELAQSSDSDDEPPMPTPSKFEIQAQAEKKRQEDYDAMSREIEADMAAERVNDEQSKLLQQQRESAIAHDLDDFFDTDSLASHSHTSRSASIKHIDDLEVDDRMKGIEEEPDDTQDAFANASEAEVEVEVEVKEKEKEVKKKSVTFMITDDLNALMEGLSDDDTEETEDEQEKEKRVEQEMNKKQSLEDMENRDEMAEEDNQPLGALEEKESENDSLQSEHKEEEKLDMTPLSNFMVESRLNVNRDKWSQKLHQYYTDDLKITFAREFVDHTPSTIMQPKGQTFNSMGLATRKYLIKMGGTIGENVVNGLWSGVHQMAWMNKYGGNNDISYTFSPAKLVRQPEFMRSSNDKPLVVWKPPKDLEERKKKRANRKHTEVQSDRLRSLDMRRFMLIRKCH